MAAPLFFVDVNRPPPGGMFFYETHGERVAARTFLEIRPRVMALMRKYGIPGLAEQEVAAYMCPRIPDAGSFCRGPSAPKAHVTAREAISNSMKYCSGHVEPFDRIERRLRICQKCPKHARDWCPTCAGHFSRMLDGFGGRRPKLPEDTLSGVCQCAKAYEMAVASIAYSPEDPVWEETPDSCWRKHDV